MRLAYEPDKCNLPLISFARISGSHVPFTCHFAQSNQAVAEYKDDAVNKAVAENYRAQILAIFGETDAAIAAVARLLEIPAAIYPGDLRYSPFWDSLRKGCPIRSTVKESATGAVLPA